MTVPIIVLEPIDDNGRVVGDRMIYHLWRDMNSRESVETNDSPEGGGSSFDIESRELPRSLTFQVECAGGLTVPVEGNGRYQNTSMEEQVASLRSLRNNRVAVSTRTVSFRGLVKTVEVNDDGKWDDSGVIVTVTVQVIARGQFGLKLDAEGNLLLPDVRRIQIALPVNEEGEGDVEKSTSGAGTRSEIVAIPQSEEALRELEATERKLEIMYENLGENRTVDGSYHLRRAGIEVG